MAERPPESHQGHDPRQVLDPRHAEAIKAFFLGDATLFYEFLSDCCEQFPEDIAEADRACAAADWPALRVQAHNLKSILQSLGYSELQATARALEQSCLDEDASTIQLLWGSVRAGLHEVLAASGSSE